MEGQGKDNQIRVTQAVLPIMREQKSGIIVNISSGAGLFGYPGSSAYVSNSFCIYFINYFFITRVNLFSFIIF
jgi:NADP-dependent 3-hydroxy acid dehydrogenase YdfG